MKLIVVFLLFSGALIGQDSGYSISGVVKDCQTKKSVMNVRIELYGSDGSLTETLTDSAGYYFFDSKKINLNREYVIKSYVTNNSFIVGSKNKNGLVNSSDKHKFNTYDTLKKKFVYDFCVYKGGCVMRLPCVRFEKNSFLTYKIDEDSFDLEMLFQFMIDNPTFVIEISGHASKEEKNPNLLSEKRAKKIKETLVQKGIEEERLVVTFFSDKQPCEIVDPDTYEISYANRNDETSYKMNRRVVMNIIRKDFTSKKIQ